MEEQDSEPLFGADVYNLLRDDSLLHRTGSSNFAALIESTDTVVPNAVNHQQGSNYQAQQIKQECTQLQVPQESPPQQHQQRECQSTELQGLKQEADAPNQNTAPNPQLQQHYVYQMNANGQLVLLGGGVVPELNGTAVVGEQGEQVQQQQEQQPHIAMAWDDIDNEVLAQNSNAFEVRNNSLMALIDESSSSSVMPDTTARTVPSLQPWPGKYNFNISVPTDNKDRNKWCYSEEIKKLYVCPNVAVPVNIRMSQWIDASITLTPVFQQSQHRMDSVVRCYNCKSVKNCDPNLEDYVVQIEGEGCDYDIVQDRHVVKVPLQSPPPGEESSTLLVKLMCLTSCVGGPNRRPFCLVLTLRCNVSGAEIGRQILDVKCCKCPSRDMNNDKGSTANSNSSNSAQGSGDGGLTKIRKLSAEIKVTQKRKKPKIKAEPGYETRYVNIAVPVEFELQVKSYVNGLIAEQILRRNQPNLLLYPEEDC